MHPTHITLSPTPYDLTLTTLPTPPALPTPPTSTPQARERQRNALLESQWAVYKDSPWLESPLALKKDLVPDDFECDACLRYSEYIVLASFYKVSGVMGDDG